MSQTFRRGRLLPLVAAGLVAAIALSPLSLLTASATGGTEPSNAPAVNLGQTNYGDTDHCDPSGNWCGYDFWALPALWARDRVQIAWKSDNGWDTHFA